MSEEISPLLAEATLQDITDELRRRYDVVLVAVIQDEGAPDEAMQYRNSGGRFASIGLLQSVLDDVVAQGYFDDEEGGPLIPGEPEVDV